VDISQDCLGTYVNTKVGGIYLISYRMATDGPLTNGAAMWAQIYGLFRKAGRIIVATRREISRLRSGWWCHPAR